MDFPDALLGSELDGFGLELGIGLGDGDGFHGGPRDALGRELIHRHEAPRPLGDHPDAGTIILGADHAHHLVFARGDELSEVTPDSNVGIRRTRTCCGVQGGIGEGLLGGNRHWFAGGKIRGSQFPVGQDQRTRRRRRGVEEVSAIHDDWKPTEKRYGLIG